MSRHGLHSCIYGCYQLADVHGSAGQEGSGEEDSLLSSREKLLSHVSHINIMLILYSFGLVASTQRPTKESRLLVAQAATSYAKADASDVDSDTKEEMSQDLESVSAKNNTNNDIIMM